jgi:GntR family transcriptional regulator, transcriptional repressor for pyruvate dehydrogenase complex
MLPMLKRKTDSTMRRTASDSLTTSLRRSILTGKYAPGQCLPTERELAEKHGVSRQVVREALRHLQGVGLVEIRRSSGCYVQDVESAAGLEVLDDLLGLREGTVAFELVEDAIEFGTHMAKEVVRLAALRRSDEDAAELRRIVKEHGNALDDPERVSQLDGEFCRVVAKATHNRVYQLVFNSLGRALERTRRQLPLFLMNPVQQHRGLERLVESIVDKDAEMAALYLDRLATASTGVLTPFLRSMAQNSLPTDP